MVLSSDKERIKLVLTETLTFLCKNGLDFQHEFSIEALIGITIDKEDVFLINMKESFDKSLYESQEENMLHVSSPKSNTKLPRSKKRLRKRSRSRSKSRSCSPETKLLKPLNRNAMSENTDNYIPFDITCENETLQESKFTDYEVGEDCDKDYSQSDTISQDIPRLDNNVSPNDKSAVTVEIVTVPREDKDFQSEPEVSVPEILFIQEDAQAESSSQYIDNSMKGELFESPTEPPTPVEGFVPVRKKLNKKDTPHHFACEICEATFSRQSSKIRHMKQHMGIFQFQCNKCDKGFMDLRHFNSHLRVKHKLKVLTSKEAEKYSVSQKTEYVKPS